MPSRLTKPTPSMQVRFPQAEALPAASFPRGDAVAVRLGVPGHQGPQRTLTSKSLPGPLSLAGYPATLETPNRSTPASTKDRFLA